MLVLNDENAITLHSQMYMENTRKSFIRMTSLRTYKSKLMRNFIKKVTGGLFDDYGIVPNEKKN